MWFNLLRRDAAAAGQPVPEKMGDVPKATARAYKARVDALAREGFGDVRLRVGVDDKGKPAAYRVDDGSLFGYLRGGEFGEGDVITLGLTVSKDGNLRGQIKL